MKNKNKITVQAPATIANVGPGFDCLGLALSIPSDTLTLELRQQKQVTFEFAGCTKNLPMDPKKNTASVALEALLKAHKIKTRGFHLLLHKHFTPGSGLGSSAASSAAAVFAANQLLKLGLSREELIPFAALGEKAVSGAAHADNVAPALLGGVTLVQSPTPLCVVKIPFSSKWRLVIMQPNFALDTKKARAVLPKKIPLSLMAQQSANLAALVSAFHQEDAKLLASSLRDLVVEPAREKLIPHFRFLQNEAKKAGALAGSIAGAGPASFVIAASAACAKKVQQHLENVIIQKKLKYKVLTTRISGEGVRIL